MRLMIILLADEAKGRKHLRRVEACALKQQLILAHVEASHGLKVQFRSWQQLLARYRKSERPSTA